MGDVIDSGHHYLLGLAPEMHMIHAFKLGRQEPVLHRQGSSPRRVLSRHAGGRRQFMKRELLLNPVEGLSVHFHVGVDEVIEGGAILFGLERQVAADRELHSIGIQGAEKARAQVSASWFPPS